MTEAPIKSVRRAFDSNHPKALIGGVARGISGNDNGVAHLQMLREALDRLFSFPLSSPRVLVSVRPQLVEASRIFAISEEHHHRLIQVIALRQGTRAENLAREHAQLTRRNLEIALNDADFLSSLPGGSLITSR